MSSLSQVDQSIYSLLSTGSHMQTTSSKTQSAALHSYLFNPTPSVIDMRSQRGSSATTSVEESWLAALSSLQPFRQKESANARSLLEKSKALLGFSPAPEEIRATTACTGQRASRSQHHEGVKARTQSGVCKITHKWAQKKDLKKRINLAKVNAYFHLCCSLLKVWENPTLKVFCEL